MVSFIGISLGLVLAIIFIIVLFLKTVELSNKIKEKEYELRELNDVINFKATENLELKGLYELAILDIAELSKKLDKTTGQKKSSEVKLGNIAEQFAPFFSEWPYDSNNFNFLGKPVDGISFEEDEIIFVEIKSGKSRLSKKQTNIKKLVNEGKVSFKTFRIDEAGGSWR